jgi:transcriptional regulator with XRE-family HTH domain
MEIMETARLNIKRKREIKGLRQQDMAEKLSMNTRSYQNLESGATKLDLERLEQIASILETSMEELLRPEGVIIHQEVKDNAYDNKNGLFYNYGIGEEILNKLLASKDSENQALMNEIKSLKEENKYLREKIDQLLDLVGKK